MKAVTQERYGGPDVLRIKEVPKPRPQENELLIRVFAAPVTAAGRFMREGSPFVGRLAIGLFKPKSRIPGVLFSGEVEEIGSQVDLFQVGDKVFGETLFNQGTHAQYVCVPQNDVITTKPERITHTEAAPSCDGHLTSMNFLTQVTEVRADQRVLIIGASGSLGTSAVQIAKDRGAHVTGVCSSKNFSMVKSLGADDVIDYATTEYWKGQEKFDVIFDTVGKSSFRKCKAILTAQGEYLSPVLGLSLLCQMLWSSKLSKKKAKFSATGLLPKQELKKMLYQVKSMLSKGTLITVIDREYTLDQVSEAHVYVDTGRKRGNVVLTIDQ